jgi:hypothetical protein
VSTLRWYNGVRSAISASTRVAIVGGPYPDLSTAKAELLGDQGAVECHAKDGARYGHFGEWVAVQLAEAPVTLREKALGMEGVITVVSVARV